MRYRRAIVGWLIAAAALATPDRATALTCYTPSLTDAVISAAGVVEATVASRRPVAPLLFHVLKWLGVGVTNLRDHYELSLADVEPLRGVSASTIRSGYTWLTPGGRYLFVTWKRWTGSLVVGPCTGAVIESSRATSLKAWIASLTQPAAGGRLFGTVYASGIEWRAGDIPPLANARVTASGPVVVETIADDHGQFGFTGLPDGRYDVSAIGVGPTGAVEVSRPVTEMLVGDHAAAQLTLFTSRSR